jgi:hypothetical protein
MNKKNLFYIIIIAIIIILFSSCSSNKKKIIGYWNIDDIDDGREIPQTIKDNILENLKIGGHFDIRDNDSLEIKMGSNILKGAWNISDDGNSLFITKEKAIKSETMNIKELGNDILILEEYVKGNHFIIKLKKQKSL